jgi:maleylpyruvate isomerase
MTPVRPGQVMGTDLLLRWVAEGTMLFEEVAARTALREPSHLLGWSRAHVTAHVARNADALVNLLIWARTGVETPMYSSAGQRAVDIEQSARRSGPELRDDLRAADARFAAAAASLPKECWHAPIRTARGRRVPASEVPWMRAREVWVHAVDLDAGPTFANIPRPVAAALTDDVARAFAARTDVPATELRASDDDRRWLLGPAGTGAPAVVTGELASLAAYATGRPAPTPLHAGTPGGRLPALPAWL